MVVLLIAMLMTLLTVFALNAGGIIALRTERRIVADSVTTSGGNIMARGMNIITASNHLMGEITGIVIVHHALGGKLLDEKRKAEDASELVSNTLKSKKGTELKEINEKLDAAAAAAKGAGAEITHEIYRRVRESKGVMAEAAILDGKVELKKWLTRCYEIWLAAELLKKVPLTYKIGEAMAKSMATLEKWIGMEYQILNSATSIAVGLSPAKVMLRDKLLPHLQEFADETVRRTPQIAQKVAREIAKKNGDYTGLLFPTELRMPVVLDPLSEAQSMPSPMYPPLQVSGKEAGCQSCPSVKASSQRDQIVKLTQLARASFPWVVYHREPIRKALKIAPLSKVAFFYKDHTDGFSKRVCDELQTTTTHGRRRKIQLYVLRDHFAPDKGFERFLDDPKVADEEFAILGLAYSPSPSLIGNPLFQQHHKEGQLSVAQGLLYNANEQVQPPFKIDLDCKRIRPNRQANVGWDTLNWKPGIQPSELAAKWDAGGDPEVIYPAIEVNWQFKLVPIGEQRWNELCENLPEDLRFLKDRLIKQGNVPVHSY